ncbi:DUF2690 domain-containing protein [Actinosynnema mirum]|uniref:DUF2690 domain-containing protein n=1 Tax=Actinosynnema mirum (strain ATCC 29888 / DSM 43827 / JCM 3225 / NBRC 14064 / NCIMB 13271 / NRRL B-12336 / IMRU 3971 / 101) TaxID=446462 RepID=C6WLL1_ACTMD|nr:DUF2690 domain-containing protein [Actinosynnema mirum]ACU38404.1 hypothetical protein Amir_4566 [Actinosynnema mirum DSM 43827]
MLFKRTAARVAATMFAALAVATATAQPALAGPEHHGIFPNASPSYCNRNAALVATRGIETEYGRVVSYVDVYYSYSCQTNWITVRGNPAGGATLKWISSDAVAGQIREDDLDPGPTYTPQVYAPGSTCVRFQVWLRWPDGSHYAETYSAGATHQVVC